jgi:hypothetical protein
MPKGNYKMRRIFNSFALSLCLSLAFAATTFAQGRTFNDINVEYTFDLPEPTWKMVVKPSVSSPNVEYVYTDRADGHLEIRKLTVKQDDLMSDIILREQEQKLQFLPGFVAGKEENFVGNLRGKAFNYEFVRAGKNMSGRFYYLKADDKTVYVVRFTGARDKLRGIRNQIDSIARTFKVKLAA